MKLNNLKQNLLNMSKVTKDSFLESIKGSNGKVDHKRLTVLAFVLVFIGITIVGLYKKTPIVNQSFANSGEITRKVAPKIVSGLVVKTFIFSLPGTWNSISAPVLLPIQFL